MTAPQNIIALIFDFDDTLTDDSTTKLLEKYEIDTNELIGEYVDAPLAPKPVIVLPSTFVDADFVSGIVTSVPSDAPYDYVALEDLKKDEKTMRRFGLDFSKIRKINPIAIIETSELGDFAAKKVCEEMGIKNQDDPKLEDATQKVYKAGFHTGKMVKNCGDYNGEKVSVVKDVIKNKLLEIIKHKKSGKEKDKIKKISIFDNYIESFLKQEIKIEKYNKPDVIKLEKELKKFILRGVK